MGKNRILSDLWGVADLDRGSHARWAWDCRGTFDDPNWLKLEKHGWTRSAQHWVVFPTDVELYETSGRE